MFWIELTKVSPADWLPWAGSHGKELNKIIILFPSLHEVFRSPKSSVDNGAASPGCDKTVPRVSINVKFLNRIIFDQYSCFDSKS